MVFADAPDDGVLGLSIFSVQSPHFQGGPCKRVQKIIVRQKIPALTYLYNTFGSDNTCLESIWDEIIARGKRHITQIHFSNEVGRRNNLTSPYDFYPDHSTKQYVTLLEEMPESLETDIRQRVREILGSIENYADTGTFILGTGLESQYSVRAYNNLYRILREEWPYEISRNPLRSTQRKLDNTTPDTYYEYHHYKRARNMPTRCILNGDGQDLAMEPGTATSLGGIDPAEMIHLTRWARNGSEKGCIMFLWFAKWQGLHQRNPSEPSRRRFKVHRTDVRKTSRLLNHVNRMRKRKARRKKKGE